MSGGSATAKHPVKMCSVTCLTYRINRRPSYPNVTHNKLIQIVSSSSKVSLENKLTESMNRDFFLNYSVNKMY